MINGSVREVFEYLNENLADHPEVYGMANDNLLVGFILFFIISLYCGQSWRKVDEFERCNQSVSESLNIWKKILEDH